jgi:hypothetical protein
MQRNSGCRRTSASEVRFDEANFLVGQPVELINQRVDLGF